MSGAATPASAKASASATATADKPAGKPATFYARIDQALANPRLQAAVRGATQRMAGGRQAAVAALPEMDALRDHARAIRAHTIAHLDRYLRQFAEQRRAPRRARALRGHRRRGGRASSATSPRRHDVQARGQGQVDGHRGDRAESPASSARASRWSRPISASTSCSSTTITPSHIVMPIIHKDRHDVARLFRRTLNATDDEVAGRAADGRAGPARAARRVPARRHGHLAA